MGILSRMFETRAYANTDDFWYTPIGQWEESKAGVRISNDSAMRCAAVYACVKVLGESVGSLPCHLYERKDRGRERAVDHWGYNLLRRQAGPRMPSNQWLETAVFHMALTGNHYSLITWTNGGAADKLTPLPPDSIKIEISERGVVTYKYTRPDGQQVYLAENNVLHIPAFSWDGITGISPIGYARETLGLTIATEEFGARFFSNGANMGTIYTMGEGVRLSQEQTDKLTEDLRTKHSALAKSHQAIILPHGITASKVSIPPDDAQWLESRKLNKAEVASLFRVPLFMIQEHEKNTSWGTGIEHMNLGFIQHTLRPWLVRIEQMLNLRLLNGSDRERYYYEFMPEALLRGDMKSSGEFYQLMIQNKVMTPNEVREKLNMNPVEWGDEPVAFENLHGSQDEPPNDSDEEKKTACECGHEHRAEPDPELDHPRMSIQRSYRRVIRDAMARVIRREKNDIMRAAEKYLRKRSARGERRAVDEFASFIREFYDAHREFTSEAVTAAFTALAEAIGAAAMREIGREWEWNEELERWVAEYIEMFSENYANQSRGQLLAILEKIDQEIDADVIVDSFSARFDEWEFGADGGRSRDDKIAQGESVRLGEGFARAAFFAAGVAALMWRATGSETCPYCMSLNGRSVGPNEFFLLAGADFQPEGAESPLRPSTNIGHPPCHAGCDCVVVPKGF